MSVQRAFIAQLQPVSRPAVAASLQQQKQRLAGTAGLYARMQAILAAERAAAECAPSPAAGSGPRLTVLDKQLEGSLTKCLCRCVLQLGGGGVAAAAARWGLACCTARPVASRPPRHPRPPCPIRRCDATAAAALGAPQVLALLQNRTAREVDTAPGSVLLLREVRGARGACVRASACCVHPCCCCH